jgi:hypothetical protein
LNGKGGGGMLLDEQPNSVFVDKQGNVGIGTSNPGAKLDVVGGDVHCDGNLHTSGTVDAKRFEGDGTALTVNGPAPLQSALDKKFDKAGGEITGSLTVDTTLTVATIVAPQPNTPVNIGHGLQSPNIQSTNLMRHRMYPGDPIVHQDIFEAVNAGAITRLGKAPYDPNSWPKTKPWGLRPIIQFGGNADPDGNGASVVIPSGYDTVWLRVLGDRWNGIHAKFLDSPQTDVGQWAGGWRGSNSYSPDGSVGDSMGSAHQWISIPAGRAGNLALNSIAGTDASFWLSGVGFSRNPWAHATQSAVGYLWGYNGGSQTGWNSNNWGYDVLGFVANGTTNSLLKVPVVPSGRDKLLYIINHNDNSNENFMCSGITVGGNPIERLLTTYDNPFSRHWNGRTYQRYVAARIPANMIDKNARFLDVKIDTTYQNAPFYFREIGTHDLEVPWQ